MSSIRRRLTVAVALAVAAATVSVAPALADDEVDAGQGTEVVDALDPDDDPGDDPDQGPPDEDAPDEDAPDEDAPDEDAPDEDAPDEDAPEPDPDPAEVESGRAAGILAGGRDGAGTGLVAGGDDGTRDGGLDGADGNPRSQRPAPQEHDPGCTSTPPVGNDDFSDGWRQTYAQACDDAFDVAYSRAYSSAYDIAYLGALPEQEELPPPVDEEEQPPVDEEEQPPVEEEEQPPVTEEPVDPELPTPVAPTPDDGAVEEGSDVDAGDVTGDPTESCEGAGCQLRDEPVAEQEQAAPVRVEVQRTVTAPTSTVSAAALPRTGTETAPVLGWAAALLAGGAGLLLLSRRPARQPAHRR